MTSGQRRLVAPLAAAVVTACAGFLLCGFSMALFWECIHRTDDTRLYCAEGFIEALPYLLVALLIAIFIASWIGVSKLLQKDRA